MQRHVTLFARSPDLCTVLISHGVENNFPRLWGTSISNALLRLVPEYSPHINLIPWTRKCVILFLPTLLYCCKEILVLVILISPFEN